jgi:hypothetical protein
MNLDVSQVYIEQRLTAPERKMIAVIPAKTYWTFVVRGEYWTLVSQRQHLFNLVLYGLFVFWFGGRIFIRPDHSE